MMDIGTAKPSAEERALVPHHLLDLVEPDEQFSAARYATLFKDCLAEISARGRLPIVVGGTGLYIRAAVRPFLFPDAGARPEVRAQLLALAEEESPGRLHDMLMTVDPEAAAKIHPNDIRRTVRALEVHKTTGRPISEWQRSMSQPPAEDTIFVVLTRERAELYARIDARAELMIAAGFLDEVGLLLQKGYGPELPAMQGLGYREFCRHLTGACPFSDAVDEWKKRTRNYAKRQLTWFRHESGVVWFDLTNYGADSVQAEILHLLEGRWEGPSNM